MVQGGLPVGQGRRNAVHQDLGAAHPELGPGAEAANGYPLADRVVVAVLDLRPRKAVEGLLEREARVAELEVPLALDRDGERGPPQPVRPSGNGDHHGIEGHDAVWWLLGGEGGTASAE